MPQFTRSATVPTAVSFTADSSLTSHHVSDLKHRTNSVNTGSTQNETFPDVFTRDERLAINIVGAFTLFKTNLRQYRTLLSSARNADHRRDRPPEMIRLGKTIGGANRRRAEQSVKEVHRLYKGALSDLTESKEKDGSNSPELLKRHPLAKEQVLLLAIDSIGPPTFRSAIKTLTQMCDNDNKTIQYAMQHYYWSNQEPSSSVAAKSLLSALTSAFEELLAALLRLQFILFPNELDDRIVTFGEVRSYASQDDIARMTIDSKVNDIIGQYPQKWDDEIAKRAKIRLSTLCDEWSTFLEVFARRNIFIHAGGRADAEYLRRIGPNDDSIELGTTLTTDIAYITRALDVVDNVATTLAIGWMAHLLPGSDAVADFAHDPVIVALENENWHVARTLSELALNGQSKDHSHNELQVNWWMARRELDDDWEPLKAEISAWEPPPGDIRCRIAKYALLRDENQTVVSLKAYNHTDNDQDITSWPLLIVMAKESKPVRSWLFSQRSSNRNPGLSGLPRSGSKRRR